MTPPTAREPLGGPSTLARYPSAWLPLVVVFGVLPTLLVPFVAIFFALVWALALLVACVAAVSAAGWGLAVAVRALASPSRRRRPDAVPRPASPGEPADA